MRKHLRKLTFGELVPQGGEDVAQLGDGDEAVALAVKDPEGLPDLLLDVPVLVNVLGHQVDELVEGDVAVPVLVHLRDQVLFSGQNTI